MQSRFPFPRLMRESRTHNECLLSAIRFRKEDAMAESTCPECGAEISGSDACPACGGTNEVKPADDSVDDRPLNVIDAKAIVVKVMWGTGALMLCGGLGALSIGAAKPAVGLLGLGALIFAGSYAVDWWT